MNQEIGNLADLIIALQQLGRDIKAQVIIEQLRADMPGAHLKNLRFGG